MSKYGNVPELLSIGLVSGFVLGGVFMEALNNTDVWHRKNTSYCTTNERDNVRPEKQDTDAGANSMRIHR